MESDSIDLAAERRRQEIGEVGVKRKGLAGVLRVSLESMDID